MFRWFYNPFTNCFVALISWQFSTQNEIRELTRETSLKRKSCQRGTIKMSAASVLVNYPHFCIATLTKLAICSSTLDLSHFPFRLIDHWKGACNLLLQTFIIYLATTLKYWYYNKKKRNYRSSRESLKRIATQNRQFLLRKIRFVSQPIYKAEICCPLFALRGYFKTQHLFRPVSRNLSESRVLYIATAEESRLKLCI